MYTLAQRLSSHWAFIEWLLGIGIGSVLALVSWVLRLGGKQRLLRWIAEIESSEQNDAAQRIMRGCNALQAQSGASTACFDFIGGLDQWRAMQIRIAQRSSCVRRSDYPICAFVVFAVAVFIVQIFEPPTRPWSAMCVAGAAIAFVWLLWTIFPVAYIAWLKGLPHPATDTTAPHLDEHPASHVETSPQRQTGEP
jgi:hypothetical protein